jgi:hypothetical protein
MPGLMGKPDRPENRIASSPSGGRMFTILATTLPPRLAALALSFLACLGLAAPASAATQKPPLVLERALTGTWVGDGVFRVPVAGVNRGFRVTMNGKWDARRQTLTLREDFVFADGEKQTLTWRFIRTGPGTYQGFREDVRGPARVFQDGNDVRLRYTADIASGGTTRRLTFSDTLAWKPDGSILNTATVFLWGLPIGSVELVLKRR